MRALIMAAVGALVMLRGGSETRPPNVEFHTCLNGHITKSFPLLAVRFRPDFETFECVDPLRRPVDEIGYAHADEGVVGIGFAHRDSDRIADPSCDLCGKEDASFNPSMRQLTSKSMEGSLRVNPVAEIVKLVECNTNRLGRTGPDIFAMREKVDQQNVVNNPSASGDVRSYPCSLVSDCAFPGYSIGFSGLLHSGGVGGECFSNEVYANPGDDNGGARGKHHPKRPKRHILLGAKIFVG